MVNKRIFNLVQKFADTLPIGEHLDSFNFSKPGILVGETGCGKSMVIPPLALSTEMFNRIIVRQPSRVATFMARQSFNAIYGRDNIEVGVVNRDQKINPNAPILEITDGILLRWLHNGEISPRDLIILDEIHATTEQLEIAMGIIKKKRLNVWCLTATIDPTDIVKYFDAETYYVSGINYPIEGIHRKYDTSLDINAFVDVIKEYIDTEILDQNEIRNALVFLATRAETELLAETISDIYKNKIITRFVHGGVSPSELKMFARKLNKPFILFATPVAEQSITLDLDDVIILDSKINVTEEKGIKNMVRESISINSLIQMKGRIGRKRPGRVFVYTSNPDLNINELEPTAIDYALNKNTPYELALILAEHGITLNEIELICPIDVEEYEFALSRLRDFGLIDNNNMITEKGRMLREIPLEFDLALLITLAEDEIRIPMIIAMSFGHHTLFNLFRNTWDEKQRSEWNENRKLILSEYSDYLSKYNIIRKLVNSSYEEGREFIRNAGLNMRPIDNAFNVAERIFDTLYMAPPEELPELTKDQIETFCMTIAESKIFREIELEKDRYDQYSTLILGEEGWLRTILDSSSGINFRNEYDIKIFGVITKFRTRKGNYMYRISNTTIDPYRHSIT